MVVATTVNSFDDPIVGFCHLRDVCVERGNEQDVLGRYYQAAKKSNADIVVRITSDCPLIDPVQIDKMLDDYRTSENLDYLSNTLVRSYPRGLDVEIIKFSALELAYFQAKQAYEREHVTPYIWNNNSLFQKKNYCAAEDHSKFRWTLDTREDYVFLQELTKRLNISTATPDEILLTLKNNPHLSLINGHIEQK